MADNDDETTDRTEVAVSNIGYAEVPDGFVFVPTDGGTGDRELLKTLFAAVDNPEDVITRPGYGYLIPAKAAKKAKVSTEDVVQVVDPSTPDTTPAEHATDTQDDPSVPDDIGDTADGPLPEGATTESTDDDTPAAAPAVNAPVVDPTPVTPDPAPVDPGANETPATPQDVDPLAVDPAAPAGDTTSTSNSDSKTTSTASAAS